MTTMLFLQKWVCITLLIIYCLHFSALKFGKKYSYSSVEWISWRIVIPLGLIHTRHICISITVFNVFFLNSTRGFIFTAPVYTIFRKANIKMFTCLSPGGAVRSSSRLYRNVSSLKLDYTLKNFCVKINKILCCKYCFLY